MTDSATASPKTTRELRKALLLKTILNLPPFISSRLYSLGRATLFRDARMKTWHRVFEHLQRNRVEGDYLEFGVYQGGSFISAYKMARRYGLDGMRFFAYDSFEGLPNAEGTVFAKGDLSTPEDVFRRMLVQTGVDLGRCTTVRGFYDETLTEEHKSHVNLRRAAVVHVDCDLYTSTKEVIAFIDDLVDVGTVIVFDDWYAFGGKPEDLGEAKAFAEWPKSERFTTLFDGKFEGKRAAKGFVMTE